MRKDRTPNAYVPGESTLATATEERIARRDAVMGSAYRLSYANPVHFVRGEGVWLYDADGEAYLDFYNNVVSLGHCHPRVVEAMRLQAETLCTNTRYLHDSIIEYSERLTALFPEPLSQAMFTCTGSEANDLACRIAKFHTGGEGFIVTEYAYHGTTALISSLSPNLGPTMPINRDVRTVPAPTKGGAAFAADVQAAINDLMRRGVKPAALLVDTLFSSDGVHPDPAGFLKEAVNAIRNAGGLFIADEVQPGFARTGEAMWGFARHDVVPDLVTIGKPMGNGYPMAGVIARPEITAEFGNAARYFNTFGGNTVAAANGLAVLNVIRDEGLLENSRTVGAYLKERLAAVRDDRLGPVRGVGLFCGIDVVDAEGAPDGTEALRIINALRNRQILISATGKQGNALKIRPPLVTRREHVDRFMTVLDEVLKDN